MRIRLGLGHFGVQGIELWTEFAVLLVLTYVIVWCFEAFNDIFVLINL